MINLEGPMMLLKAATYLMAVGQQGVKLYKRSKDPKGPNLGHNPDSPTVELVGWVSGRYLHLPLSRQAGNGNLPWFRKNLEVCSRKAKE